MKILRQTPLELVTVDSTIWISMICALASLPLFYVSVVLGRRGVLFGACFFAICAMIGIRKMTFVFDAMQRMVRWKGWKPFKVESGIIPFDEITDIGTEAISGGESGGASYRLTILTPKGAVPMAYAYGGNSQQYESLRKTILSFVNPDHSNTASLEAPVPNSNVTENDSSIRSLLMQDRKIDAITLVKTREHLDLTQAVQRVKEVEKKMKVES
jgi:hypothetical protein